MAIKGVRINVGPAQWQCGRVTGVEYTRSGYQVTTINGRRYATTFDWRDWPKRSLFKQAVLFKKRGRAQGHRLIEASLKPAPRGFCKKR